MSHLLLPCRPTRRTLARRSESQQHNRLLRHRRGLTSGAQAPGLEMANPSRSYWWGCSVSDIITPSKYLIRHNTNNASESELNSTRCCISVHRAIEDTSPHSAQTRKCRLFRERQQSNYATSLFRLDLCSKTPLQVFVWLPNLSKSEESQKSICFWPVAQGIRGRRTGEFTTCSVAGRVSIITGIGQSMI